MPMLDSRQGFQSISSTAGTMGESMIRFVLIALLALPFCITDASAAIDPRLATAFQEMYALDFANSESHFAEYVREQPADPFGYAASAACVLFTELDRLKALDAEFYVDDKKLFAEPQGKADPHSRQRLFELTGKART